MLKKLTRQELLEMLIQSEKHVEQLERELEEAKKQLADRRIQLEQAGSIAEAALKISGIFEAAQKAADLYLENIGVPVEEQPEDEPVEEPEDDPEDMSQQSETGREE